MDIKSYIESGILEQYVLGDTTEAQNREVLQYSNQFPEIKEEIEAIEQALFNYAQLHAQTPPPEIKAELFSMLDGEFPSAVEDHKPGAKVIPIGTVRTKSNTGTWLAAASVVLLIGSAISNVWLYNNWKKSEAEFASLDNNNKMLVGNLKVEQAKYTELASTMGALGQHDIRMAKMTGQKTAPNAMATVYWNEKSNDVYLKAEELAPLSADEQYQLWAMVDGKPADAGVFDTKDAMDGFIKMKNMQGATAFAVTKEKRGGSPVPNMDNLILFGQVS
ncbi:MAG: anti-sigma factor [Bacteroidia bacterium]|nr:anti-sigma factor [Bacteroidia bacterium]